MSGLRTGTPNTPDDWQQALEAESLPLNPNPVEQQAAAARTLARRASSKQDLVLLLDALALPSDDDTLITLLPLLGSPEGDTEMRAVKDGSHSDPGI